MPIIIALVAAHSPIYKTSSFNFYTDKAD